ncbi:hypothetical protein [Azospirillum sp. Sh1]|uniref:hypothetical protein n=1 Tax=Azospirillum sp. Sh1 TaxID=2607285 RepID=UPI0011F0799C|nr:hypothetical protein [Azospirillum sp. Sh1]KAA0582674.1 hypothetical protein FZ029_00855 [Azospirillum sp. Sh1]
MMNQEESDHLYKSLLILGSIAEAHINKIDSLNLAVQFLLSTVVPNLSTDTGALAFIERLQKLLDDDAEQVRKSYEMVEFVMEGARKHRGD